MSTLTWNQYEYKVIPLSAEALSQTALNDAGAQGWHLVATMPSIIFERQISPLSSAPPLQNQAVLLTISEVAAQLSISRTHLYALIHAGRVRTVRLGKAVRIPAASIWELLQVPEAD